MIYLSIDQILNDSINDNLKSVSHNDSNPFRERIDLWDGGNMKGFKALSNRMSWAVRGCYLAASLPCRILWCPLGLPECLNCLYQAFSSLGAILALAQHNFICSLNPIRFSADKSLTRTSQRIHTDKDSIRRLSNMTAHRASKKSSDKGQEPHQTGLRSLQHEVDIYGNTGKICILHPTRINKSNFCGLW